MGGEFLDFGVHHGRTVFRRRTQNNGGAPVFLYYWDGRDGVENSGWWFGQEVGGSTRYCRNRSALHRPPREGWCVPWNGRVENNFLVLISPPEETLNGAKVDQVAIDTEERGNAPGEHVNSVLEHSEAEAEPPTKQTPAASTVSHLRTTVTNKGERTWGLVCTQSLCVLRFAPNGAVARHNAEKHAAGNYEEII